MKRGKKKKRLVNNTGKKKKRTHQKVLDLSLELLAVGLELGVLVVSLLEGLLELVHLGLELGLLVLKEAEAGEGLLERLLLGVELEGEVFALLLELVLLLLESLFICDNKKIIVKVCFGQWGKKGKIKTIITVRASCSFFRSSSSSVMRSLSLDSACSWR